MKEVVEFRGHPLITASHKTTLELTKDTNLTNRGNCIIGVSASKACSDLSMELKELLRISDVRVKIRIAVQDLIFDITAKGQPTLILTHTKDIVVRKSNYVCSRTLIVSADKSAADMPRKMVEFLQNQGAKGKMIVEVNYP